MPIIESTNNKYRTSGYVDETYDPLSYQTVLKDLQNWKQAGGYSSNEFNEMDTPGWKYFRIMFHFFNGDEGYFYSKATNSINAGYGLIHPTWLIETNAADWIAPTGDYSGRANELKWWNYSTAYSYLKMNGEDERAEYLKNFIELLSNISTYSPWYFQSINGMDEAINRSQIGGDWKFEEKKHITINCLEDAVDNRIGTLLDLYRAAIWSWRTKRFIVPANLRKFDMTVAVIQAPIKSLHHPKENVQLTDALGMVGKWLSTTNEDYATFDIQNTNNYLTSYKMYEFHNCEIDYNSSKSGVESMDNSTGWNSTYKIDITFDDVEEYSYNEFLLGLSEYGDLTNQDTTMTNYTDGDDLDKVTIDHQVDPTESSTTHIATDQDYTLEERLDNSSGLLDQLVGGLTTRVANRVDSVILGNMFGFSLNETAQRLGYALDGNFLSVLNEAINESDNYNGLKKADSNMRNIGDDSIKEDITSNIQTLGNIFEASTVIRSEL